MSLTLIELEDELTRLTLAPELGAQQPHRSPADSRQRLAEHSAWHGLGLHPYLPRTPSTRLQAPARHVWLCDGAKLPTALSALPLEWDFQQLKALPESLVDNGFCEWNGHCLIEQADLGYALDCQATGSDYYLLYCPVGLGFFCIEPVSHPVNAHHLPGRPGLRLLEQGQSTELGFTLQYRPLQADAPSS